MMTSHYTTCRTLPLLNGIFESRSRPGYFRIEMTAEHCSPGRASNSSELMYYSILLDMMVPPRVLYDASPLMSIMPHHAVFHVSPPRLRRAVGPTAPIIIIIIPHYTTFSHGVSSPAIKATSPY